MGEFRPVKGIDVLIDAIAKLNRQGRACNRNAGRRRPRTRRRCARRSSVSVWQVSFSFRPAMPAREAQALGRIMVIPSRAESLPYVVLEAAAAGMPLITTKVGGIPEIYGPLTDRLVAAQDAGALADAIAQHLDHPGETAETGTTPARARGATLFGRKHGRWRARPTKPASTACGKAAAVKTLFATPISLF